MRDGRRSTKDGTDVRNLRFRRHASRRKSFLTHVVEPLYSRRRRHSHGASFPAPVNPNERPCPGPLYATTSLLTDSCSLLERHSLSQSTTHDHRQKALGATEIARKKLKLRVSAFQLVQAPQGVNRSERRGSGERMEQGWRWDGGDGRIELR